MGRRWEQSGIIERDSNDDRAIGAIANFFVGATTTPLTVYQDADEGTPHETDVESDGYGRWPLVFIPFCTSYDVRVRTAGGTQLYYYREIPNPDPVEASEDTVDATELIATGHVHWEPIAGTKSGYVRLNGRTIGNGASGGTERANADTADLFTYLWNNLANGQAAVSTGRGGSAAADYAANKTIALLDGRSGVLRGLDDMGNSAASRLGSTTFTNGNATTAGSVLGANSHALIEAELASHLHAISLTSASSGAHTHTYSSTTGAGSAHTHTASVTDGGHSHNLPQQVASLNAGVSWGSAAPTSNIITTTSSATTGITVSNSSESAHTHSVSGTTASDGAHTHTVSGNTATTGSGTAHNNVSYGLLGTFYCKL